MSGVLNRLREHSSPSDQMRERDWERLKCRFGCDNPVAGLVYCSGGCICHPDEVQALCAQHMVKGVQNNANMVVLVIRDGNWEC